MSNINAIIFDCFGVIYPQAGLQFLESYQESFARFSSAWVELNLQIDLGQITRRQFYEAQEKITGVDALSIMQAIDNEMNVDRNLVAQIDSLKHNYKIGLLSNAGKEELEPLYRDKIDELFDSITASYEVGIVKPDKAIFLIAAQRLGVEPEQCLFVDDSMVNIEAAQKVGMKTLFYPAYGVIPRELINISAEKP